MRAAVAKIPISMTVALTEDETLGPFGVKTVPSTVFLDKDGVIVAAASGPRDQAFFEARVRALLGE